MFIKKPRFLKNSHNGKKSKNAHVFDNALMAWKAPEYVYHEKSFIWFFVAALIALALIIYGLETGSWTFSLAIAVFAGTYYLSHRIKPKIVDVKISKIGIKIGRHIFPYSHIRGFWIVYNPPFVKKLYFKMTSKLHPHVVVLFENEDPATVRGVLSSHIEELKGIDEPFSDTLTRLLRL